MDVSVEDYLVELGGERERLVRRVLEIAGGALPELKLKFAPGWGTINMSAPKFLGCVTATKHGVRIYLEWGTELDDPNGYIDRFGSRTAQKDIVRDEDIDDAVLADLFRQAAELANL